MRAYIIKKLPQDLELLGDLRKEDGYYYFTVKVPVNKDVSFENSIFEFSGVDTCFGFRLKLKVEANYLEFAITTQY